MTSPTDEGRQGHNRDRSDFPADMLDAISEGINS